MANRNSQLVLEKSCISCKYLKRLETKNLRYPVGDPVCTNEKYEPEMRDNIKYCFPNRPEWCDDKVVISGKRGRMGETEALRIAEAKALWTKQRNKKLGQNFQKGKKKPKQTKAKKRVKNMVRYGQHLTEWAKAEKERILANRIELSAEIKELLSKIYLTKAECYDKILSLSDRETADYCYEMIKIEKYMDVDMAQYHPIILDGKMYFGLVDWELEQYHSLDGKVKVRVYKVEFYNEQPAKELWLPKENILPKTNKNLYIEIGGVKYFTIGKVEYDQRFRVLKSGVEPECCSCSERFPNYGDRFIFCEHCKSVFCLDCLTTMQKEQGLWSNECVNCGNEMWIKIV